MTIRYSALAAFLLVLLALPSLGQAEDKRSLPFNKQTVYNYFRKVEEAKRTVPEEIKPDEYQRRMCQVYVQALKQTGYDFEATVQNAAQFAERGHRKLDDPRFLFLVGVFQYQPDVFVQLGLLSKTTRDAVMAYMAPESGSGGAAPPVSVPERSTGAVRK
jgi:hypothetical protein